MSRDHAEHLAHSLMEKFNNPGGRLFYLKCAYQLSEVKINNLIEVSMTKNKPAHYFTAAARREMV